MEEDGYGCRAEGKAAAALLQIAEVREKLGKVSEEQKEFEGKMGEIERKYRGVSKRMNILLVKQVREDKMFLRFTEQSLCVFNDFVHRIVGDLLN